MSVVAITSSLGGTPAVTHLQYHASPKRQKREGAQQRAPSRSDEHFLLMLLLRAGDRRANSADLEYLVMA